MRYIRIYLVFLIGAMIVVCTTSASTETVIMPLGDSITRGCCPEVRNCDLGYRLPLYRKLIEANISVKFVGSQEHPDPQKNCEAKGVPIDFDKHHEGYYGKTADFISNNVYEYLENHPTNIVLLHIGTNDINIQKQDVSGIVDEVIQILDKIDDYENDNNTKITVILARICNKVPKSDTYTQYNNLLADKVHKRITKTGDDIHIVDMEVGANLVYKFEAEGGDIIDDNWDVHPNDNGYKKIAEVWFQKIKSMLPGPMPPTGFRIITMK